MAHEWRLPRWVSGWPGWRVAALALLLGALLSLPLAADVRAADDDGARVGRIAATQGRVWLLDRADAGGQNADRREAERWHDSSLAPLGNWPLGRGDRLRTGTDGRAVLQFDTLTLRLGPDAELHIEQLDADQLRLWLPRGDLALHVLALPLGHTLALRTPEGRLWPARSGHYRASRVHDSTQATAWAGEWRFDADDSALTVGEGRRADFWLQGRPPRTHYNWMGVDRDAFADWARREARADAAATAVPPPDVAGLPGASDLQRWGDWRDDPEAGRVWQPRQLPPGWAPYRDGRWVRIAPRGWTWIDAAPWGFTPFHDGQWLLIGGRWCWSPGPRLHPPHPNPPHLHPPAPPLPAPRPHLHPQPHLHPLPPAQPLRPPMAQQPQQPPPPPRPPAAPSAATPSPPPVPVPAPAAAAPRPPRAERGPRAQP